MRFYRTPADRREKQGAIEKHSYQAGIIERLGLVDACSRAAGAGGETELRTRIYRWFFPKHRGQGASFRHEYVDDPNRYGRYVAERGLSSRLKRRLSELSGERTAEPFMVVKSLYPTSFFGGYSGQFEDASDLAGHRRVKVSNWYLADSYYDLISSGVLYALGTHHHPKSHGDKNVHRDYFTTPAAEIDQFSPDHDFPRRFRQAVPEFALKDEPSAAEGRLTARYVVYVCVENPVGDPLWVLPVRHVFENLSAQVKNQLRESLFEFFDHWEQDLTARGITMAQKIIGLPPNDWLSFDADRFNWDYEHTKAESYPAVGQLRHQIITAGLAHALPIVLKRGDALIVDNYRALVRRTEGYRWNWSRLLYWRPTIRWLRMYCGFPEPSPHTNADEQD